MNIKKGQTISLSDDLVIDWHCLLFPLLFEKDNVSNMFHPQHIMLRYCIEISGLMVAVVPHSLKLYLLFGKTYNFNSAFLLFCHCVPCKSKTAVRSALQKCPISVLMSSLDSYKSWAGVQRLVFTTNLLKQKQKKNTYQLSLGRSKFHNNSTFWAPLSCYRIISSRSPPDICPAP